LYDKLDIARDFKEKIYFKSEISSADAFECPSSALKLWTQESESEGVGTSTLQGSPRNIQVWLAPISLG
jgi:hypothetical protein